MKIPALAYKVPLMLSLSLWTNAAPAMDDAQLTEIVRSRLHGDRTGSCMAVAVINKTVSKAFVCADPGSTPRIDAKSSFEIGSVTKTMASLLLARLIEDGKASLEETLEQFLPAGTVVPTFGGQPIRLRDIVTHRSGLPALPPGVAMSNLQDPYASIDEAALLGALAKTQLTRAPGSQFEYSNFAMMLLSVGIAKRAGRDLETLLAEELFQPAKMRNAYISKRPDSIRAAQGHLSNGQPTPAWSFQTNLAGVGGVRATLDDLVRYIQAYLGAAPAPLNRAMTLTLKQLTPDQKPEMAMNWMLRDINGHRVFAHEGGTGGFSSLVAFDPQSKRGVAILSDTALTHLGGLGDLGLHLLDHSVPLGKPRKAVTAPKELIDSLVGEYQLIGAMKIKLTRNGNSLVAQAEGQPAFTMGYDDAGDFYPLQFDALLKPGAEFGGKRGFEWHQGGGVMQAVRIADKTASKAAPLSPRKLDAYVGDYSLTADFSLRIAVKDDHLTVQGTGQPAIDLEADGEDRFSAASVGATLQFERNANNEVVAVRLLQGGADLRGEKR
jgi:D-alanyl-D-alanine-carboxypeptidase/D-alanyl-D-alanine-endopeptidase